MNDDANFEAQFRNMVATPNQVNVPVNHNLHTEFGENKKKVLIIALSIVSGLGMIIVIILIIQFIQVASIANEQKTEKEMLMLAGTEGQDDSDSYRDFAFNSEQITDAPLLVYSAVKNKGIPSPNLLEEFRVFSKKYSEEYNDRRPIPDDAKLYSVNIVPNAKGELYPYLEIKRILIDTSSGCARFDFYDDFLVVYDYELSDSNCSATKSWNYLGNTESK